MKAISIIFLGVVCLLVFFFVYVFPKLLSKIFSPSKKQIEMNQLFRRFKEDSKAVSDEELEELKNFFSTFVPYVPVFGTSMVQTKYCETLSGIYLREIVEEIRKREKKNDSDV